MKDKEFIGDLKSIDPARIVSKDKKDQTESFFLVLGIIYNDLKGLILFKKLIVDNYRPAKQNEITAHSGELGGITVQIDRLLIGNIHEFLKFINQNKETISSYEFKEIIDKTNSTIKNMWRDIIDVACGDNNDTSEFKLGLMKIRSNVVFHYSDKELRRSYINIFFNREKIAQNELAYYSIGETMEETRFYYADAAVEEYLRGMAKENERDIKPSSMEGYSPELSDMVEKMNFTIMRLMKAYLKSRPKK